MKKLAYGLVCLAAMAAASALAASAAFTGANSTVTSLTDAAFGEPVELNPVIPFLAITGRPTDAELAAKVASLKTDGFDQFLIYARSGLQYKYMGEEWLHAVETLCREAEQSGMKVYMKMAYIKQTEERWFVQNQKK